MNELEKVIEDSKVEYIMIRQIADHYGLDSQLSKTAEECVELAEAIIKQQNKQTIMANHIIEEMADVYIMLIQLIYLMDCFDDFKDMKAQKLKRQIGSIENGG